jgi:hypothetical protein
MIGRPRRQVSRWQLEMIDAAKRVAFRIRIVAETLDRV